MTDLCELEVEPEQLIDWMANGETVLIDVREEEEFQEGHLPQAHLLPLTQFEIDKVPESGSRKLVFYCRSGRRSLAAAMKCNDYKDGIYHLKGGILAWQQKGFPVDLC